MNLSNDVVLRPRFNFEVKQYNQTLLERFESTKQSQSEFIVTRIDDHVFIKLPKEKQHFWSPQLHLEILETGHNNSKIYGLFGPKPSVWTLFMFLHFIIACLFIGCGIWAYTNWSLEKDFAIQLFLSLLMVIIWGLLYVSGRLGKKTGMHEMHQLHRFMRDTLRKVK